MKKIYFGDFHQFVLEHIKAIEKTDVESYTTEWFLLRYLKKITKITVAGNLEYSSLEGPMRSLIRFYIDNIDEHSDLGDRCLKIHDQYRTVIRKNQSSKYN